MDEVVFKQPSGTVIINASACVEIAAEAVAALELGWDTPTVKLNNNTFWVRADNGSYRLIGHWYG